MTGNNHSLTGRTAIVTGAARGIGLEIARHLHEEGATVYLLDRDEEEVTAAAEVGGRPLVADVSNSEAVETAVARAANETGRLDIVINNAGVLRNMVSWKLTDEDWELVLGSHLGGTFRMTPAAVPYFRQGQYGRIVNVTAYTGLHGTEGRQTTPPPRPASSASTKTAAKELATFGVTVNAISPNAETRLADHRSVAAALAATAIATTLAIPCARLRSRFAAGEESETRASTLTQPILLSDKHLD